MKTVQKNQHQGNNGKLLHFGLKDLSSAKLKPNKSIDTTLILLLGIFLVTFLFLIY